MKIKNWKTTLVGFLVGLIPVGQEVLHGLSSSPEVHIDYSRLALGLGMMLLGKVAKDYDVTGGSRSQPTVYNRPSLTEKFKD